MDKAICQKKIRENDNGIVAKGLNRTVQFDIYKTGNFLGNALKLETSRYSIDFNIL
jgi:hypothetical protein